MRRHLCFCCRHERKNILYIIRHVFYHGRINHRRLFCNTFLLYWRNVGLRLFPSSTVKLIIVYGNRNIFLHLIKRRLFHRDGTLQFLGGRCDTFCIVEGRTFWFTHWNFQIFCDINRCECFICLQKHRIIRLIVRGCRKCMMNNRGCFCFNFFCRNTYFVARGTDNSPCSSCPFFRLFFCLHIAGGKRPCCRQEYRSHNDGAQQNDRAVYPKTSTQYEKKAPTDQSSAVCEILRKDFLINGHYKMMPYGEKCNVYTDDAKEFFCIEQSAMMNNVLQADEGDDQDRKRSSPAEQVAKEIRKEKANKTNVPSENTYCRNKSKRKKDKTDEFILPS